MSQDDERCKLALVGSPADRICRGSYLTPHIHPEKHEYNE